MTTTTTDKLTPGLVASIKHLLEIRSSAIEDLERMPAFKVGSQWQADRINDVEWTNNRIEETARRLGMGPMEMIGEVMRAGR